MVPWWLPVNFVWNALVMAGTLAAQGVLRPCPVSRLIGYLMLITVLGALVDTVWQIGVTPPLLIYQGRAPAGAYLRAMPIAVVALGVINFLFGARLLRLRRKEAVVLGCTMGLLTAPWSIVLL